jgi:hypothetical protein
MKEKPLADQASASVPLRKHKSAAQADKKPHPVGVCKSCGGLTYHMASINQRCGRSPKGQRCTGKFSNASRDGDWRECASCKATGKIGSQPCIYCLGIGWSLTKPWSL